MERVFVTVAAAATLALGVYLYLPQNSSARAGAYQQNYLEALADANSVETPDIVGPLRLDLRRDSNQPGR
jgi:ABC-type transport system involved in cytochrome c biogenesis permease subunit